jgi:PAS domain S-box-containing protein
MQVSFADGASTFLYGSAAPLFDAQGRTRGAVAAFVDVTQLKAAQDAARQAVETVRGSEARLARAQRIARLGDWELDLRTDAVSWSDEMYRLFGLAPGAFVPTLDGFLALVPPEDHAPMLRAFEAALAGRGTYNVDHRILMPDGSVRVVNEQAEVLRDGSGAPVRVVGKMHDVTDRHRAEADLRESRQRLRAALEAAEMGTWRLDLRTQVATRDAGMSRLLGLPHEEASEPAEAFFARVHPEDRAGVDAAFRRAVADRGTYFAEFRVGLPDGSTRWLREQGKVLDDRGAASTGGAAGGTFRLRFGLVASGVF